MGVNVVMVVLMLMVGYSYHISPTAIPLAAGIGLGFPVFVAINIAFLLFWMFFGCKKMIIGIVGFALCFLPVRMYVPFNIPKTPGDNALKVMSFNCYGFRGNAETEGDTDREAVVEYLVEQRADILCLQEVSMGALNEEQKQMLFTTYPYHMVNQRNDKGEMVAVLSQFPIISSDSIRYESKGNLSMVYKLKVHGDTVVVINNHLESTHIDLDDRANFRQMVKGNLESDDMKMESKSLLKTLGESAKIRAGQASKVAECISANRGKRLIVCGDFNDSPISYSYHTISQGLKDAFVSSGNGFGWTYCRNGMRVRIDHVLCSEHYKPVKCIVDNKNTLSDHYSVICWLENADIL